MNYIKRNRSTIIAVIIFLALLVVAFQIKNIFFPNEEKALYGDRLKGKDAVKITNNTEDQIESALENDTKDVTIREAGRIINVIITAKDDANLESAKALSSKVVEQLKKEQLEFYDIQLFIEKDIEAGDFPIIGYKHHTKDSFSWTKDRAVNS